MAYWKNTKEENHELKFAKWEKQFEFYHTTNEKLQLLEEEIYISKKAFIDYVRVLSAYINNNLDYVTEQQEFKDRIKIFNDMIYSKNFVKLAQVETANAKNILNILPNKDYLEMVEKLKDLNSDFQHELSIRQIKIKTETYEIRDLAPELDKFKRTIQDWLNKE